MICIFGGIFLINRLRDTPQSLGLPPVEKFRDDYPDPIGKEKEKQQLSAKEILWEYVLTNKYIWILAFAYFFVGVIRTAVNEWSIFYLVEIKNYKLSHAGVCVAWFEVGGFLGSLAAGWASDIIFKGKRIPVIVLCALSVAALFLSFQAVPASFMLIDSAFLFLFGFFVFGPQMLIGMVPAELSHKKAAATATGFVGCFAYLGAAFAGGPLGAVIKEWGWDLFFVILVGSSLISVLLVLPFWSLKSSPRKQKPVEE